MPESSGRTFRAILIAFAVGLIAAGGPLYLQLREARQQGAATEARLAAQLEAAREKLAVSEIHSRLGLLLVEARAGRYDEARRLSTQMFDRLGALTADVRDADARRRLAMLEGARDEFTAKLATGDASVAESIERLFVLLGGSL